MWKVRKPGLAPASGTARSPGIHLGLVVLNPRLGAAGWSFVSEDEATADPNTGQYVPAKFTAEKSFRSNVVTETRESLHELLAAIAWDEKNWKRARH